MRVLKMVHYIRLGFTTIIILLVSVSAALSASINVISLGNGNYAIQGNDMDGVAGIDLSLNYNSLSPLPTVTQGGLVSGAMMVPNLTKSGVIRIAVITAKPFSGSGLIAKVVFAPSKNSDGLTLLSANLIDSNGAAITTGSNSGNSTLDSGVNAATAPTTASTTISTAATTTSISSSIASSATLYSGRVILPIEAPVPKPAEQPIVDIIQMDSAVVQAKSTDLKEPDPFKKTLKPDAPTLTSYTDVLERFRLYQGKKTPASFIALFGKEVASSIRQAPAVVLSDGKTRVRITVVLSSPDEHSPNFVLNGAQLISLTNGNQRGAWIIEVLPKLNTLKATLTILNGPSDVIEFPLVVAPPLSVAAFNEVGFVAFPKNSSKTADLNKDGIKNYIDEYIYTANYLVRRK